MNNEPIVKINNISKSYIISHDNSYNTIRDSVSSFVKKPFQIFSKKKNKKTKEKFWALKDINLNIYKGERVGIIGNNGAGKSTLLKILSQITSPDTGSIELNGRVASLLEVGTGFHPELSGRENIFLNGAILGMKRAEIISKFDEIVEFSEIEKFIDTPVKRYSSGMFVRLAFSVAAHLEPEILIVDEVLAVGDADFQKKCLGKMKSVSEHGRTVIFVSHNLNAIASLCNKCIVLEKGEKKIESETTKAINYYRSNSIGEIYEKKGDINDKNPQIIKAWIENKQGEKATQMYNSEPISVIMQINNKKALPLEASFAFYDHLGRPVWNFTHAMHNIKTITGLKDIEYKITFFPPKLTIPELTIDFAIGPRGGTPFYDHIVGGLKYTIIDKNDEIVLKRFPEWPVLCNANVTYKSIN